MLFPNTKTHFMSKLLFVKLVATWTLCAICFGFASGELQTRESCKEVKLIHCKDIISLRSFPNIYGHRSESEVRAQTQSFLQKLGRDCPLLRKFVCAVYLPPCVENAPIPRGVLLPCRSVCEAAKEQCHDLKSKGMRWPRDLQCQNFPTEKCIALDDKGAIHFVEKSLRAHTSFQHLTSPPAILAPLEAELGDSDDYSLEVVSLSASKIPQRRYDVIDLGDDTLFQGWADVQGTGAANDYCRVIGRSKRKFMSCALAGTTGQTHHYVSKLGFNPGHINTWFMRDVDNDGRDDYCRCVGEPQTSELVCMKAGVKGFYGSTMEGGSQYTFELPGSAGCHNKRLNPHHGS